MTADTPDDAARLAEARAHLAAARLPHAAPPGPGAAELRRAYLDLLKLAVCDLTGASTISVGALEDGSVVSRQIHGDALRIRCAGMDWPLQGLTMVGLSRLDDLQACIESVVEDGVAGDVIEAGSWRGGASLLARATLDTLGDRRTVWIADSFDGFPAEAGDPQAARLSRYDFLAVPLEEVRGHLARLGFEHGLEFVPGFFEETLPALVGRSWSVVRLDGDTYDATRVALECLYPGLAVGGYLIVDDYSAFDGCREAVDEFRRERGITEPIEQIDAAGVRWRRADPEPEARTDPRPSPAPARARERLQGAAAGPAEVPTARELSLAGELGTTRARLDAVTAERDHLAAAPWRAPRAWVRAHRTRRRAR